MIWPELTKGMAEVIAGRSLAPLALALALLGVAVSPSARAGDVPLYRKIPDWVKPAPEADALAQGPGQPSFRIIDMQVHVDHGEVWSYFDTAVRIDTPGDLTGAGTVSFSWAPDHGDLIIHSVDILRGGKRINALSGGRTFSILRRESELESLELNGVLTATLQVEGLQVGDTLQVRHSQTQRDPALNGHAAGSALLLPLPFKVGFGRSRLLWPADTKVAWKPLLDGVNVAETVQANWKEVSVSFPVAKQPDPAANAPGRFKKSPLIEFSDFADWQDVSRTMAPLYRVEGSRAAIPPGGDLDQEVNRIAAATPDPRKRTALALQLVQDKVRYFAVTMNGGNYVPQTVEQTWSKRYGDCKAKTLLLLAVLHRLGIAAEAALANLENGDLVQLRLPSNAAFNHVFVLASVGGKTLWLDGTGLGSREADLDDVPDYGWVLPLRAAGAELTHADATPPARPILQESWDENLRGGLDRPAPFTVHVQIRGSNASRLNTALSNLDSEAKAEILRASLTQTKVNRIFLRPQFTYDEATVTATIVAEGLEFPGWSRADTRYILRSRLLDPSDFPDRSRTIWQAIPIILGRPNHSLVDVVIHLPDDGKDIGMEGAANLDLTEAGLKAGHFTAELSGGNWRLHLTDLRFGGEIPVTQIPTLRKHDAELVAKAPLLRTAPNYPATWRWVERAKHDHVYDKTLAILDQWIAEKPEDADRIRKRAEFFVSIFERTKAIAEFGKVLALNTDKTIYRERAYQYERIGDLKDALADLNSAIELDPSDRGTLAELTRIMALTGAKDAALAGIDAAIDSSGENKPFYLAMKAEVLIEAGDGVDALAQNDAAIEARSGNAWLLNERCWNKGRLNTDLEGALQDCTRAIQLSETVAPLALDSRGLVYLRLNRLSEALADANAAIDLSPATAGTYFLRALIEKRLGQTEAAARDLEAAKYLFPTIATQYTPFGLGG